MTDRVPDKRVYRTSAFCDATSGFETPDQKGILLNPSSGNSVAMQGGNLDMMRRNSTVRLDRRAKCDIKR
jgi:hypothetical protein